MPASLRKNWLKRALIALGILLVCAGAAISFSLMKAGRDARTEAAQAEMKELRGYLSDYRKACGRYPVSLYSLTGSGYGEEKPCAKYHDGTEMGVRIRALKNDPWNRPWGYVSDGESYRLSCEGPPKLTATDSSPDILETGP